MSEPMEPLQSRSEASPNAAKPWWRRWWGVALIVLGVLVVLAAITGDPEEAADVAEEESVATEDEDVAEPDPEPAPEPEPEEPPAEVTPVFDPAQARVVLPLQAPGFTRVEVHFVHEDGDVDDAAVACVDHYLQQYDSVFCYGFATEADFEDAQVDEEQGGVRHLCWTARADKANPDADRTSQGGGPYDPECPSAS